MRIHPIRGLKACSLFTKLWTLPLEVSRILKIQNAKSFLNLILIGDFFRLDELDLLFSFILDDNDVPLDPQHTLHMTPKDYIQALGLLIDYVWNLDLGDLLHYEGEALNFEKIEKTIDRVIQWNQEKDISLEEFLSTALKTKIGI